MSVKYSAHNLIKDDKTIIDAIDFQYSACFSNLANKSFYLPAGTAKVLGKNAYESFSDSAEAPGHIIYDCVFNGTQNKKKNDLDWKDLVVWYSEILNSFGLTHTIKEIEQNNKNKKIVKFKVLFHGVRLKMLSTLCALRYLDETPLPEIISFFYKHKDWAGGDLEKLFQLFQISHYCLDINDQNRTNPNSNHSLIPSFPGSNYGIQGKLLRLSNLENFNKNINNQNSHYLNGVFFTKGGGYQNAEYVTLDRDIEIKKLRAGDLDSLIVLLK